MNEWQKMINRVEQDLQDYKCEDRLRQKQSFNDLEQFLINQ